MKIVQEEFSESIAENLESAETVYISTGYLDCSPDLTLPDEIVESLQDADVRILFGKMMGPAGEREEDYIEGVIEAFGEDSTSVRKGTAEGAYHAKALYVERVNERFGGLFSERESKGFVGSSNLTSNGLEGYNEELNVVFSDDTGDLEKWFERQWKDGSKDFSGTLVENEARSVVGDVVSFDFDESEMSVDVEIRKPTDEQDDTLRDIGRLAARRKNVVRYKIGKRSVWNSVYGGFDVAMRELDSVLPCSIPDSVRRVVKHWIHRSVSLEYVDVDEGYELRVRDGVEEQFGDDEFPSYDEPDEVLTEAQNELLRFSRENDDIDGVKEQASGKPLMEQSALSQGLRHLIKVGYYVRDSRCHKSGASLACDLDVELRGYQERWVDEVVDDRTRNHHIISAPPGCGKTIGAIGVLSKLGRSTLILVPKSSIAKQWKEELLWATTLDEDDISIMSSSQSRDYAKVTIMTYQLAVTKDEELNSTMYGWGLLIADEAHHAPAEEWQRPILDLEASTKIGLTATPLREREDDRVLTAVIGPVIHTNWKRMSEGGYINVPDIHKVVTPVPDSVRETAKGEHRIRRDILLGMHENKLSVIEDLLDGRLEGEKTLIFADYSDHWESLSDHLDVPYICGSTDEEVIEERIQSFKDGDCENLIVSRIGDEGLDVPDAESAIIASWMGGSRVQGTQRAGRVMRAEGGKPRVYYVCSEGTNETATVGKQVDYLKQKLGVKVQTYDKNIHSRNPTNAL